MRKKQLQIRRQRQFKRQEERIISSLNLHTVCQVWAFRQRQRKMWQRQLQIKRQIYLHTGYRIMSSPGKKEDDWKNSGKTNTNRTNWLQQKSRCSPTVLPFWVPTDISLSLQTSKFKGQFRVNSFLLIFTPSDISTAPQNLWAQGTIQMDTGRLLTQSLIHFTTGRYLHQVMILPETLWKQFNWTINRTAPHPQNIRDYNIYNPQCDCKIFKTTFFVYLSNQIEGESGLGNQQEFYKMCLCSAMSAAATSLSGMRAPFLEMILLFFKAWRIRSIVQSKAQNSKHEH